METSAIIMDLKTKAVNIARDLRLKEAEADKLRIRLKALDNEIQTMTDQYDSYKMAVDALELVHPSATRPVEVKPSEPEQNSEPERHAVYTHSRTPKKILKFDSKGKKIGEFSSINKCAKSFGWTNRAMKIYIEENTREKQIKLRGYYLEFAA